MEFIIVVLVVLLLGYIVKRSSYGRHSSDSVSNTDFEDSDSQFGNIGMRDITGMSSDGKRAIRDVGDIGL